MSELPPESQPESLLNNPEAFCERVEQISAELLRQHDKAHAEKPFHNGEHPRQVIDRIKKIARLLGLEVSDTRVHKALLLGAGHDVEIAYSVNEAGIVVRNRGGSREPSHTEDGEPIPRNEFDSVQHILQKIRNSGESGEALATELEEELVAIGDATYPAVAPESIPPSRLRVVSPDTNEEVDLSKYALGDVDDPKALAIRQPYLHADSSLSEIMMALADLSHIGMGNFEEYTREGNAEFRELQHTLSHEEIFQLETLSARRKAEIAKAIFSWWKTQVTLPLKQQELLGDLLGQSTVLNEEQKNTMYDAHDQFERNAIQEAAFYNQMLEQYGDLKNEAAHQQPESFAIFKELLQEIGYDNL